MITRETLLNILENTGATNISIYLPTHVTGEEVQQDHIRLKNTLNEIEKELRESGMKDYEIDQLLEKPRQLLNEHMFWLHNDVGLALFIAEEYFEYFRVPLEFDEQYLINSYFLITPLLPMVTLEGTFCILVISQKEMRLIRATRDSFKRIPLKDSPTNMEEFKKYDVYQKNVYAPPGPGGRNSDVYQGFGWGEGSFDSRVVENYLKIIENEVTSILRKRNDPLILAGNERVAGVYQKVNHYDRLLDEVISGNPDPKKDEEIRDEAWQIIKSYFLQDMYENMVRFGNLTGSNKQSSDLSKIVEGAYFGKVDTLFIPIGEQSWGWFDEQEDSVHFSKEKLNGYHDLINVAAIKTLTQGGDVYALKKEEMPNNASIAAIFRYP